MADSGQGDRFGGRVSAPAKPHGKKEAHEEEAHEDGIIMYAPESYGPDAQVCIGETVLTCEDGAVFVPAALIAAVEQAGFGHQPPVVAPNGHAVDDEEIRNPHAPLSRDNATVR